MDLSSIRTRAALVVVLMLLLMFLVWRVRERREEAQPRATERPGKKVRATAPWPETGTPLPTPEEISSRSAPTATRGTIRGRVTETATGAPVAGAEVFGGRAGGEVTGFSTTTDASGAYSVEVDPGDWEVDARAPGFAVYRIAREIRETLEWRKTNGTPRPEVDQVKPYRVAVAAGGVATFDATLTRGVSISGLVTDLGGSPIEGAAIRVRLQILTRNIGIGEPLLMGEPIAKTDAQGRFNVGSFLPEGEVELVAVREGFAAGMVWVDVAVPEPRATIALKPTLPLEGLVADERGVPIAGAWVFLADAGWGNTRFLRTGDDGTFRIDNPWEKCEWIGAWAPGHAFAGLPVDLDRPEFLRISLPASPGDLRGTVKDVDGDLVAGARIIVTFLRRSRGPVHGVLSFQEGRRGYMHGNKAVGVNLPEAARAASAITDAAGAFALPGLVAGGDFSVEIAVLKPGFTMLRLIVSSPDPLELTISPGEGEELEEDDWGYYSGED